MGGGGLSMANNDGESRKRDICRCVWVYGEHFYEHLNRD